MANKFAMKYSFPNGSAPSSTHSTTVTADTEKEAKAIIEKRNRSKKGVKFVSVKRI